MWLKKFCFWLRKFCFWLEKFSFWLKKFSFWLKKFSRMAEEILLLAEEIFAVTEEILLLAEEMLFLAGETARPPEEFPSWLKKFSLWQQKFRAWQQKFSLWQQKFCFWLQKFCFWLQKFSLWRRKFSLWRRKFSPRRERFFAGTGRRTPPEARSVPRAVAELPGSRYTFPMSAARSFSRFLPLAGVLAAVVLLFCSPVFLPYSPQAGLAEWEARETAGLDELLARTERKPYRGEAYVPGRVAGTWNSSVTADPKSFNLLVAERDAPTAAITGAMHDYLVDYDTVKREWYPRLAYFEIKTVDGGRRLDVVYTLRENLAWSFYNSDKKVPVTSDDVVFWYDGIVGDPEFESSGYNGQFLTMEDGSMAHIDIEKLDERRFVFHFPRVIAEPLLHTNMDFGPAFLYRAAKERGGAGGVLDILGVDTDPRLIPSVGQWFLAGYAPGLRLKYARNGDHWEKGARGSGASGAGEGPSIPYKEETMVQILSDANTQFLVFKSGDLDSYQARTEDLDDLIFQSNKNYTVYNAEGSLSASFWSFNQNPAAGDASPAARARYEWFTRKEFRQAMSCILNRDRIIAQVYGGLAEPKLNFFPEPNPFYNGDIKLQYTYDPGRAARLLESIGIRRNEAGIMRDREGRNIEFDLSIPEGVSTYVDIAFIIADEAEKIGVKINIRALDFQKIVEQLTRSYDWSSVFLAFGAPLWPTQGSNVWPSTGNLHLWYPLQKTPATEWEARVDYLYNEGSYTIDKEQARVYWDEYQRILLEQCPLIYLVRPRSFYALHNRWDASNFYYDNIRGADVDRVFLRP